MIKIETMVAIKKFMNREYNSAFADNVYDAEKAEPYINKLEQDVCLAKENADLVFFCPHIGGQFNLIPGLFTEYVFSRAINAGCDAIIASHPHVVQKAEYKSGVPCFYSIGNFSMSPNSVYLLHENLPNYGLAVHLYVEEKQISRVSFSVLKIVETKKEMLTVYPVDELYEILETEKEKQNLMEDVSKIIGAIKGKEQNELVLAKEYYL